MLIRNDSVNSLLTMYNSVSIILFAELFNPYNVIVKVVK